jgi:hypothetical protein
VSHVKSIQQAANEHYAGRFDDEMRELIELAERGVDDALEELQEIPLSVEKVTTNHRDETIEWEILLGTGGPADRVLVTTDLAGMVDKAVYQFQDWFQPWTTAGYQDEELVQRFAEIVGYYEEVK